MAKSRDRLDDRSAIAVPADVPKPVVSRLSLYLRELQRLKESGRATVSSTQLGKLLGFTDAQVRKDLAYFGQLGHPGIGYRCDELTQAIRRILGTAQSWNVALVGLGNLGRALLRYRGFGTQGFRIAAAFDIDPAVTGQVIEGVPVHPLDQLETVAKSQSIYVAVITVPATEAQRVADQLIAAGIEGILNFAPVTLTVPQSISVVGVDLAIELEQLTFSIVRRRKEAKSE